jgi:hypothetical protein
MEEHFKETGTVLYNEEPLCSGSYNITKFSNPERQTRQFGTFEVSGIVPSKPIAIFKLLQPPQPPPELILVIKDKRRFNINLFPDNYDFERGFAQFNIRFLPGSPEI